MRCAMRNDFDGQIASCGRELGHDGMHTGVLNDQGVQWKRDKREPEPSTSARAHLDELSESELQQRLDKPEPRGYEHSDLAAFEHVLPDHGDDVTIWLARGGGLRGTYDTALIVDTLGVQALVMHAAASRARYVIPWHFVANIEQHSKGQQS